MLVKLTTTIPISGTLFAMAYDDDKLYGAGSDWSVYCIDLKAKKFKAEKKCTHHDNYISSLVLYDGMMISAGFDRRLVWTELKTGKKIRSIEAHSGWIREVIATPDGKQLISVGDDMKVRIHDARSGKLLQSLEGHKPQTPQGFATALYAVAVSSDGKTIASGDRIGEVCLWEAESGQLIPSTAGSGILHLRCCQTLTFHRWDSFAEVFARRHATGNRGNRSGFQRRWVCRSLSSRSLGLESGQVSIRWSG